MKYLLFAALFFALAAGAFAYHDTIVVERPSASHVYYDEGPRGTRYSVANDYDYRYTYSYGYRESRGCVGNGCAHIGRYTHGSYGNGYRQMTRYNEVYNFGRCPRPRYF